VRTALENVGIDSGPREPAAWEKVTAVLREAIDDDSVMPPGWTFDDLAATYEISHGMARRVFAN